MRAEGWLVVVAMLATCCAAGCNFGPVEENASVVDLSGWMELPTGSGSWSVYGADADSASQRYSGGSSFLVSDFELGSAEYFSFKLRMGEEDGLVGLVLGLTCLPGSGTIYECDNELIPQVVWGRGTEDTAPGLCAHIGRFPSLLECPVAEPQCGQCEDMNAPAAGGDGFGPSLPIYASQVEFHTGFLTCCDRFCDSCDSGQGWIADQEYDVVVHFTPERLQVFFNGIRLFNYLPSLVQQPTLPATSRIAFATKSHADVDFSSTKLLYGGTAACAADPWTAVQTLVMDDCADDAYIGVEYGDGSTDWFVTLQESYELSHVYEEVSSTGAYSVRMSLYVGGRTIRNTFKAYVKEPVSIGISAEPAGCGFTGTCTSPYGTVNVDYVLGGTAPYTISWDPPASYTVVDTECSTGNCNIQPHQYLAAGEYVAIVTDARGCIALSEPVTITRSTISITGMTETSCGAIDVDVSYNAQCEALTYHWVTTDGDPIADPTLSSQTELSSGSYWVTVTDANGCSDTASSTLSFGITNYFPRQTIVSGTQDTISWAGYPRYTEGVVSLICPDRSTRLYHGDLHDVTSASFLVSGGSSAICSLNITCNSGCTDTVGPIYYCLSSEYNRGECPRDVAGDDDEFY